MTQPKIRVKTFVAAKTFLVAIVLLTATACGSGGSGDEGSSGAPNIGSITVGVGPDASFASLVAAVNKGFFKKHGIDAKMKVFSSGGDASNATSTGEIDVTTAGQFAGMGAAANGAKINVLASAEYATKQMGIVADKSIKSPSDLEGRTVAMQEASTSVYFWDIYKKHYNLKNVKVKMVGTDQTIAAFAKGQMDAYVSWQPNLSRGVDTVSGAHVLAYSGDDGLMNLYALLMSGQKLANDPKLAEAMMASLVEASAWCEANRDELTDIMVKQFKAPEDLMKSNVAVQTYKMSLDADVMKELQRVADFIDETMHIKMDMGKLVISQPLKDVDPSSVAG